MVYLQGIQRIRQVAQEEYPFTVPAVMAAEQLKFTKPITIFCGDNGCGKTTLMEILAEKTGAIRINDNLFRSPKNAVIERASKLFRVYHSVKARKNFYFTAEEFIKYIDWIEKEKAEARRAIAEIDASWKGDEYSAALAKSPHYRTIAELDSLYISSLNKRSHGEGFIDFFTSRLVDGGLYLMDEPEGALSYENQYVLSLMIKDSVERDCQFIIATHSPVIAAIPDADIFQIDESGVHPCEYDLLNNVMFLRMFLKRKDSLWDK